MTGRGHKLGLTGSGYDPNGNKTSASKNKEFLELSTFKERP